MAAQVPGSREHPAVGQLDGVVPDQVGEVGALAPFRQRRLEVGVELAQIVPGRVGGQEGPLPRGTAGHARVRPAGARWSSLGFTSPQHEGPP